MALTANREVDHFVDQQLRSFQAAAVSIFKGALLGLNATSYARGLVAGDGFVGVAYEECLNTAGSAGDKSVRVYTVGDFRLPLTAATNVTHIGRPVFASDDATLTFTAAGNSYVGLVQDVPASGTIILRIDPQRRFVKTVTHAVENLAADADIAARAIHSFTQEHWIVAARVVNQATAATGIDGSNTCVVALATGAGAVASVTFDGTPAFPDPNEVADLGTISNAHATAGEVLTLAVTNGTAADPGPFLVEVDYV